MEHYVNETSLTIFKAVKKLKITKKVKNYNEKKICKNLNVYLKMEKTIKKLCDIEIEKQNFHRHKRPISVKKQRYL